MKRALALFFTLMLTLVPLSTAASAASATGSQAATPTTSRFSSGNRQDGEVVALRTRTSDTYAQDGHYVAKIYPQSINYRDARGAWQPIDNTLVAAGVGSVVQNRANRYTVRFPADLGTAPLHVETAAGWVDIAPDGASGSGHVAGNTDTFMLPGASVQYAAENDSLKETITLQDASAPHSVVYHLHTGPSLTVKQDGASVDFVDASGAIAFSFAPPFMRDAAGAVSQAVTLTLGQDATGQTVTLAADPAWLASSARQYPVVIDPTVVFQGASQDCSIAGGSAASTNFCGGTTLSVGYNGSAERSLLYYDLSGIPATVQVLNAELGLHLASETSTTATAINAYQVTRNWMGNTAQYASTTWNTYDGTNAWTNPGGDFVSPAAATNSGVGGTTNTWYQWYPTALVQGWVNGTVANDGLIFKEATENVNNVLSFDSSQAASSANWPYLQVSYEPRVGEQSFYTFDGTQALTDSTSLGVNVANGNLVVDQHEFAIPGVFDQDLGIDRTYNNLSPNNTDLGNSWVMDTGRDIGLLLFNDGSAAFYAPSGYQIPFSHNADGSFTAPTGIDATLTQNSDGTYTLTFHDDGETYHFTSGGYLTSDADRAGNTLSFAYNASGQISAITDTQGRTTSFTYNTAGDITQITDPAGRTYQYAYDTNDNLTRSTDAAGKVTTFAYDANYNLTQITDPAGKITKFAYDANNRVTSITDALGHVTSFAYNAASTTVTDPNNHTTTYAFDANGRVTAETDPLGHTTNLSWTGDSHVQQEKLPSSATTNASYDVKNNLTQLTLPTQALAKAQYANSSLPYDPSSTTDTQGNTTSYQYNSQGLVTSVTDAAGHTTSYSRNANGTLASLADANGHVTSYSYGSNGLLAQVTNPSPLGSESFSYDNANRLASETDGKGQKTSYTYDALDQATGISYADGTSVGYAYDADGNLVSMTDATGTTTYTYDADNQLTQEKLPNGNTVSYTYDAAGNLLSKTDSGGTVSDTYTADDQLATVKDPAGAQTSFGYDVDGNRTSVAYPNGVGENLSYDGSGNLTKIWATNASGTLDSYSYSYTNPANSQPTELRYALTDVGGNVSNYSYDGLNRLTQALTKNSAGSQTASYGYGYDPVGNLTSENRNGTTTSLGYNAPPMS